MKHPKVRITAFALDVFVGLTAIAGGVGLLTSHAQAYCSLLTSGSQKLYLLTQTPHIGASREKREQDQDQRSPFEETHVRRVSGSMAALSRNVKTGGRPYAKIPSLV